MKDNFLTPEQLFQDCKLKLVQISKNEINTDFHPIRCLHSHEHLEVVLFVSGTGRYIQNATAYDAPAGTITILNKGLFHAENFESTDGMYVAIGITGVSIPGVQRDHLIPADVNPVIYNTSVFAEIYTIVQILQKENALKKNSFSRKKISLLLQLLLLQLYEMAMNPANRYISHSDKKSWTIGQEAREYAEKYYIEGITVQKIADYMKISPVYLSHVFKNQFGYSLIKYLTDLRIGNAQTLLSETSLSVTEIAHMVGYNSTNNFYLSFRKVTGYAPSEYRKILKEE